MKDEVMEDEVITIPKSMEEKIKYLEQRNHFLKALENGGVDNWAGFGESIRNYEEQTGIEIIIWR